MPRDDERTDGRTDGRVRTRRLVARARCPRSYRLTRLAGAPGWSSRARKTIMTCFVCGIRNVRLYATNACNTRNVVVEPDFLRSGCSRANINIVARTESVVDKTRRVFSGLCGRISNALAAPASAERACDDRSAASDWNYKYNNVFFYCYDGLGFTCVSIGATRRIYRTIVAAKPYKYKHLESYRRNRCTDDEMT